ncbi:MAG TPA: hypothetical protein PKL97_05395 [Candidatus Omnitrophota bacterium]|nr:hypothetical protein [Candidatus Omnitrophota bacterium]
MKKSQQRLLFDLVCLAFLLTGALFAGPVDAPAPGAKYSKSSARLSVGTFHLPPILGTVEEVYQPDSKEKSFQGTQVFYVQSDHRVYEIQKKIQKIIALITESSTENFLAGLEGGAGEIDPAVFRAFPDYKVKEKIIEGYLESGELTGAEASAILNDREILYCGIEDLELYRENCDALLAGYRGEQSFLDGLRQADRAVTSLKQQIWSKDLRGLDISYRKYQKGQMSLQKFLKHLRKPVRKTKFLLAEYPAIETNFASQDFEKEFEEGPWRESAEKFIWEYKDKVRAKLNARNRPEFDWQFETYRREIYGRQVFASYLMRKAKELRMDVKAFESLDQELQRASRLGFSEKGALEEEIDRLVAAMKTNLTKSEADRALLQLEGNLDLLRKLARFEGGYRDVLYYFKHRKEFSPEYYLEFIKKYYPQSRFSWDLALLDEYYRRVLNRSSVFFDNLKGCIKKTGVRSVILITGRFHREEITELFKKAKIAYAVIEPRQPQKIKDSANLRILEGRVSFKEPTKGKDALEPPLAMGVPEYRDRFYSAATEAMWLRWTQGRTEPEKKEMLSEWQRSFGKILLLRKDKNNSDLGYIRRLQESLRDNNAA